MKINLTKTNSINISNVAIGETFLYEGAAHMRIAACTPVNSNSLCNAVKLSVGRLVRFTENDFITPRKLMVVDDPE